MAEKLKSIIKRIPSSLLLKSVAVAALWLLGREAWSIGLIWPFVLFAALALYLYGVPPFKIKYFWPHFALFGVLSLTLPPGTISALALGVVFFLLLGIKDLVFVNRGTAYEMLAFTLLFLSAISAYGAVENWAGSGVVYLPLVLGIAYAVLAADLPFRDPPRRREKPGLSYLCGFLVAEATLVLIFLPLDFLYQVAILMLLVVLLAFLEIRIKKEGVSTRAALSAFLSFAVLSAVILLLNSWRV